MEFISPLPFTEPAAFLDTCKAQGFTPVQARLLWEERGRFGYPEVHMAPRPAAQQRWDDLRQMASRALAQITSPADWEKYWINNAAALSRGSFAKKVKLEEKIRLSQAWVADGHDAMMSRDEWIDRLSVRHYYLTISPAEASAETWDDVLEALVVDVFPLPVPGPALSLEELGAALTETGVQRLAWNLGTPATPLQFGRLAANLLQAQAELQQATGWKGPVLGMGGRVQIHLDTTTHTRAYSGTALIHPGEAPSLLLAGRSGWRALAHEWLHIVDHLQLWADAADRPRFSREVAHSEPLAISGDPAASPWGSVWQSRIEALRAPVMSAPLPHPDPAVRWAAHPDLLPPRALAQIQALQARSRPPARDALLRIIQGARTPQDADDGLLTAEVVLSELEVVAAAHRGAPGSAWHNLEAHVAQKFQERARAKPKLAKDLLDHAKYLGSAMEQVAFAFEASLPPGAMICGWQSAERPALWPQAEDPAADPVAWRAFFTELAPWWEQLRQPAPELPVSPGIAAKRGTAQRFCPTPGPSARAP